MGGSNTWRWAGAGWKWDWRCDGGQVDPAGCQHGIVQGCCRGGCHVPHGGCCSSTVAGWPVHFGRSADGVQVSVHRGMHWFSGVVLQQASA